MQESVGQKFWLGVGLAALTVGVSPMGMLVEAGAIALFTTNASAQTATLTDWRFDPNTRQLQVTIPEGTTPRYFLLAQPARIVLDLPDTEVGMVPEQQTYSGSVRSIRVGQFQPGLTRIVMELSPDAQFAPGQVELQQVDASTGSDRWVLRPLLTESVASAPPPAALRLPPVSPPVTPSPPPAVVESPEPAIEPIERSPATQLSPDAAPVPSSSTAASLPETSAPGSLPPLEPNAVEIPIEDSSIAAVPSPIEPPSTVTSLPLEQPLSGESAATTTPSPTVDASNAPGESAPAISQAPSAPVTLPPATFTPNPPATIRVPSLSRTPAVDPESSLPPTLPPAIPSSSQTSTVRVPPLSPAPPQVAVASNSAILIPSGTVLSLRYPRETTLKLEADRPWQEVLVLSQAIQDETGAIVVPEGSQVIGRFETGRAGSRFIAQAITLQGQNLRMSAQSEPLEGDREVENGSLLRNSAIGALALAVLTGFTGIGALGGAAVGAGATFLTAPQPAVIQPNQILEVRLTQDLPR